MTALLHPAETLTLGTNVITRPGDELATALDYLRGAFVAPQDWVALTGPCPTCDGTGHFGGRGSWHDKPDGKPCDDCRDGRRIVPLYRECPEPFRRHIPPCPACNNEGRVLVGRGIVKVVPVVSWMRNDEQRPNISMAPNGGWLVRSDDDISRVIENGPWPVPGRDFGVVIDCVELA